MVEIFGKLSKRETEILSLIALGYGNRKITEELYLNIKTVEHHINSMLSKVATPDWASKRVWLAINAEEILGHFDKASTPTHQRVSDLEDRVTRLEVKEGVIMQCPNCGNTDLDELGVEPENGDTTYGCCKCHTSFTIYGKSYNSDE